jgi:hypothetical protein
MGLSTLDVRGGYVSYINFKIPSLVLFRKPFPSLLHRILPARGYLTNSVSKNVMYTPSALRQVAYVYENASLAHKVILSDSRKGQERASQVNVQPRQRALPAADPKLIQ